MKTSRLWYSCQGCKQDVCHENGPHILDDGTTLYCPRCGAGTVVHFSSELAAPEADYPDETFGIECDRCASTINVTYGPDPYALEINDDDTDMWLCENCRQESADGI